MRASRVRRTTLGLGAFTLVACSSPSSSSPRDGEVGDGGGPTAGALFRDDLPWDRDVSSLRASAESNAIITALETAGGWGTGDFRIDMSIDVLGAAASTPRVTFVAKDDAWAQQTLGDPDLAEFWRPDCDEAEFPLPANGAIEGESGYACTGDGDCHLIVVDQTARRLFEMWRADRPDATLYGGCAAVWDLDADYDPARLRGRGCSSADAGGFPITAMLATADEVAAGEVPHALRFILPNDRIRDGIYVPPATHSTFATSGGPDLPPYGVRLRLRPDFDESGLQSEGARVLARALKRYGMFLADGGNLPVTIAGDRFTTAKWTDVDVDARSLSAIRATDFEVVEYRDPVDWRDDTTCYRAQ